MFDRKQSGTIDFHEFQALWKYVTDWQHCFRSFDRDNSGTIDRSELKTALTTFGNISLFSARWLRCLSDVFNDKIKHKIINHNVFSLVYT